MQGDVADPEAARRAMEGCESVVHFAAETHVDRSIVDAGAFLRTNVLGTYAMLETARALKVKRFVHISTDEVYGSTAEGFADEQAQLQPNSPYAASKTSGDHLARAYFVTYGLPVLIVRASNNYGPYQFPEKFLPLMVTNLLEGEPVPIYGDGKYVREWLFVEDFCEAIELLLMSLGEPGQVYNVGSSEHRLNLEVVDKVLALLGKPKTMTRHVTDRPGHDRRYAIDCKKLRAMGWSPRHSFEIGMEKTVRWYEQHPEWWRPLKAKAAISPHR